MAYVNSICVVLTKCYANGFEFEQCDSNKAFLYGKPNETIFIKLPGCVLLLLEDAEGEEDFRLYRLQQVTRLWNETIDKHLKHIGFKAADADPCVYTRGEGTNKCVKDVIPLMKAGIVEMFRIKGLRRAHFILGIKIDYDIKARHWSSINVHRVGRHKYGQENA
ncbi:Retrovirusrelated Pol Polyprotein from transposon TNT 1-94 [Phytophthora megakarya]|uniref:Retrovirusrelated Pol Polyprotein from transposon TNT 1-94 n=1 Tax=Phytophthora megakarya TaxID=4795 RepID=A0A225W3M5_9STRA|nr:Retrovirusrelated Pol Polyprotein from transposon TNT 1-94 [Phytophthora megakarya]